MKQALLLLDNPFRESLYSLNLNLYVGLDVVKATSVDQCKKYISKNPNIKMVITQAQSSKDNEEMALRLIEYLHSIDCKTPLIVLGEVPEYDLDILTDVRKIDKDADIKTVLKAAAKASSVTAQEMAKQEVPDPFPIPINYFKEFDKSPMQVQKEVRLSAGFTDHEVVFEPDAPITSKKVKQLNEEGSEVLYIPASKRLEFVQSFTEQLMKKLVSTTIKPKDRLALSDFSYRVISDQLDYFTIDKNTVKFAKANIDSMIQNVKNFSKLDKLLAALSKAGTSYRFTHAQLITYVAFHILEKVDWGKKEQQDKLAYIAFFHDIALDSDAKARIHTEEELKKTEFDKKDKDIIRTHAKIAHDILSSIPDLPIGAEKIILQHHGTRNGIGFSSVLLPEITPLARLFYIAHDFVDHILQVEESGEKNPGVKTKEIIAELGEKYKDPRDRKMLEVLKILEGF